MRWTLTASRNPDVSDSKVISAKEGPKLVLSSDIIPTSNSTKPRLKLDNGNLGVYGVYAFDILFATVWRHCLIYGRIVPKDIKDTCRTLTHLSSFVSADYVNLHVSTRLNNVIVNHLRLMFILKLNF